MKNNPITMIFMRLLVFCLLCLLFSCNNGSDSGDDALDDVADMPGDVGDAADFQDPVDTHDPVSDDGAPVDNVADDPAVDDAVLDIVDLDGDCPAVPIPDPVSETPLEGEWPPGRFEATTVDGFDDVYLFNTAESLKVGVRRQWGGTVIFYGMVGDYGSGMNPTNVIDANDTGREVQVAFYDPDRQMQNCAHDASCRTGGTDCPNSITYLGWNPVQGGNRCNRGSGDEGMETSSGVMALTTNPLFWNPNWDRTDCDDTACSIPDLRERRSDVRVIQTMKFVSEHVVQIEYTVINLADMDHAATGQEMPTVYTANGNGGPDLWKLFNSEGAQIPINEGGGGDGFFHKNFDSPGGWACMQNDGLDYGVGMYAETRLGTWQAWQLRSLPFNNFRPLPSFGIPALGTVRARVYLIIGSMGTIASEAGWLDDNLPPFGVLDSPADDETISGVAEFRGWALDNKGVASVELVVDGTATAALAYGGSRPDVCSVWTGYAGCDAVGYAGNLDTTTLTPCGHIVEVLARDEDGNEKIIARRRVFVAD